MGPYNEPISGSKLREHYKDVGNVFTVARNPFCCNLIRKASLLHSKYFCVFMKADLLYSIPILAQNQGIIGETNVRHLEVLVIRLKSFYNMI